MPDSIPSLIIAIDGYSSCGKSSFAKYIASILNYTYIDSGAMYRAVTLYAIREKILLDDLVYEKRLREELINLEISFETNPRTGRKEVFLKGINVEEEIRGMKVSENVSPISKIGFVRKKMVAYQRKMGEKKSVVMDGRDIGTVVFPKADIKLFMTADPLIRAERRFKELQEKGIKTSLDEVESNIRERDFIDQNRYESPLRKADDAIVLDNSYMTIEDQIVWFKALMKEKFNYSINEDKH
jgi:CMP/dCMP kinase